MRKKKVYSIDFINRGKYDIACKEQQKRVKTLQNELQVSVGDEARFTLQKRLKKEMAILEEMTFIVLSYSSCLNPSVLEVYIWTNLSLKFGESMYCD